MEADLVEVGTLVCGVNSQFGNIYMYACTNLCALLCTRSTCFADYLPLSCNDMIPDVADCRPVPEVSVKCAVNLLLIAGGLL